MLLKSNCRVFSIFSFATRPFQNERMRVWKDVHFPDDAMNVRCAMFSIVS